MFFEIWWFSSQKRVYMTEILFYFILQKKGANQKQFLKIKNRNCLHFQRDHIRSILEECLLYIEQMDKSIAKRNTQRRKNIYCWSLTWYGTKIHYFALLRLHVDVFHGWINLKGCQSLERFQALGRKQLSHANLAQMSSVGTWWQSNTTIVIHDLITYERWTILEQMIVGLENLFGRGRRPYDNVVHETQLKIHERSILLGHACQCSMRRPT